jgi:predicted nucleic acid-binding protein
MIVVDASVLVTALVDDGPDGDRVRARLRDEELTAPHLVDVEVVSVCRKLAGRGRLDARRADQAIGDLASLPLQRVPHAALMPRCWELRDNVTTYDAVYVALAEHLRTRLVTGDARLAAAPGPRCEIEVLRPG